MKNITLPLLLTLTLLSCGQPAKSKKKINLPEKGSVDLIVLGVTNIPEVKSKARELGLGASGEQVLILKGDAEKIARLEFEALDAEGSFEYAYDRPVQVEKQASFTPERSALYLAKKDFGLLKFWKKFPKADGRGVKTGVIDDGISPHQSGFLKTSTGERKFLKKASQSSFSTFDLNETENGYEALIDEARLSFQGTVDLNADGEIAEWKAQVDKDLKRVCVDTNGDGDMGDSECAGNFGETGEYLLAKDGRFTIMFEIDSENKKLKIFQPERGGDSHGEGVASVLAGYRIGDIDGFDGVAPGAQILDYDLSEKTDKAPEYEYSLSTFLKALDWLGSEGAQVANISYSLFFSSAKTQAFMRKALDQIIKKHNMIVSFSAGNNGPGLGSLNRRGIYPSSALVAGAFVSKELDEAVHGVTGIPEEGRVIYYSSRGPGLGVGPTLIAPLSSLVNSSPDGGHRAFSGTSSAAPALAGAATVLISAINQQGLEFNAETAVNALKLSGKRLKAEPFIFQGAGLPQIDKALAIYKELVAGKKFMNVKVEVDRGSIDGQPVQGVFLKTSQTSGLTSARISLTGAISPIAPASSNVNLLVPVKLKYTKGITGPSHLWISSSASSAYVDISPTEMLGDKLEAFGEVQIVSSSDDSVIATVPVTAINDRNILDAPEAEFELDAQEGLRFPVHVPAGVKGFKVKAQVLNGDANMALLSIYDTNQNRLTQKRISSDLWVETKEAGYYQIGVAMTKGTARGLRVKVSTEAINAQVKTRATNAEKPKVSIENLSSFVSARLTITPLPKTLSSSIMSSSEFDQGFKLEKELGEGDYYVEFSPIQRSDLQNSYTTCTSKKTDADGKVELGGSKFFSVAKEGANVALKCMPFDEGGSFTGDFDWKMSLKQTFDGSSERLDILGNQTKTVEFPKMAPGSYKVELEDPFNSTSIELGVIELI